MSIEDASTVRGKLYELGTVEIRWVGRWLNNNVKHFIDATLLAKDRHENVYRAITSSFDIDSIEKALDIHALHQQGKSPPPEAQDPQRFTARSAEVLDRPAQTPSRTCSETPRNLSPRPSLRKMTGPGWWPSCWPAPAPTRRKSGPSSPR
jgi:hypothetical protein